MQIQMQCEELHFNQRTVKVTVKKGVQQNGLGSLQLLEQECCYSAVRVVIGL